MNKSNEAYEVATRAETFRELIEARHLVMEAQRAVNDKVIRKCVEEGWTDAISINWTMIAKRSR